MNRRQFLQQTAIVTAGIGLPGTTTAPAVEGAERPLDITVAGYAYDRVAALTSGKIGIDGCVVHFEPDKIGTMNTHVFSGPATRDVTEIGLHPFMLAVANEGFRGYSLLPVFPLRVFRHKSIFIRTDRGIRTANDLKGKRVATPGFSSSSLTWIRGILQDEYGVSPSDIEWYLSDLASSAAETGQASKFESIVPPGLTVQRGPRGKDESDMLADGDVDALFHAAEPRCYIEGHPLVDRLFPDFRAEEQGYFAKTGIFPIMHAVAMRDSTVEANPWLPEALFRAYSTAKSMAYRELVALGWAFNSLPWVAQEIVDTRKLMGENFWPYGIGPNQKALGAIFRYSYEQKLSRTKLSIEDLFHPSTLHLSEH